MTCEVTRRVSQINIEEWDSHTRYDTSRTKAGRLMLGGTTCDPNNPGEPNRYELGAVK
jgi:hypothetical protein